VRTLLSAMPWPPVVTRTVGTLAPCAREGGAVRAAAGGTVGSRGGYSGNGVVIASEVRAHPGLHGSLGNSGAESRIRSVIGEIQISFDLRDCGLLKLKFRNLNAGRELRVIQSACPARTCCQRAVDGKVFGIYRGKFFQGNTRYVGLQLVCTSLRHVHKFRRIRTA